MQIMNNYLTLSILGDVFGWIGAVVIVVFLFGLVMVLARRDKRRRDESASAGIVKAAGIEFSRLSLPLSVPSAQRWLLALELYWMLLRLHFTFRWEQTSWCLPA